MRAGTWATIMVKNSKIFFLENDSLGVNSMRKIDFSRFQSPKTITLR
jgi:hypothetical protein